MPDSAVSPTSETGRRSARNPSHSHFFRRSFRCGQPDEFIEVRREQKDVSCRSGDGDNELCQSQIGGRRMNSCCSERDTAMSDKSLSGLGGETLTNGSCNTIEDEVKRMQDLIVTKTEIQHVSFGRRASMRDSESNHESPRMSSCSARPLEHETASNDGDALLPAYVTSMLSSDELAFHPQFSNSSTSYGRVSAFVEHLIDEYASSFDDTTDPPLKDLHKYSDPRPAPAPPIRKRLSKFIQQRTNTSPRVLTRLASISNSFRKLRLDLEKSAKTVTKTEPDTDSPDWACRTSLAIEAGKISMYSVSRQDRESASSKHIPQTLHSPTKPKPAMHHLVHDARWSRRRNTCPAPARRPSESNSILSVRDRHSEGAPQAVERARAALLSGRLAGMETTLKEKVSMRRDSAQANMPMDLNKSLPALPALRDRRTKGEDSSWI